MFKKKPTPWKTYTFIAVILWFLSILMAGGIIGDIILAITAIPALLAIIYIFIGIFDNNKNSLLKKGKEYLITGGILYLIHSVVYYISNNNSTIRQVVYATNGVMGTIILLLIILGIIFLIRGYHALPTSPSSNGQDKKEQN